ncbi:MAG TPA: pectate lyase [Gemmatimonadaceae bacterium]|nr:pectate lyase [Gemmatimonadaceae bacterium]
MTDRFGWRAALIACALIGFACALPSKVGPGNSAVILPATPPAPPAAGEAPARSALLLSTTRIRALAANPEEWLSYVERSRAQRAIDTASMAAELRSAGKTRMVAAPFAQSFEVDRTMNRAWFATDNARTIAEAILSFQAPNGGWSKHVSYAAGPRKPGQSYFSESAEWQWISTIDNSSTTEQMLFLVLADSVRTDERFRAAYLRGLEYLVAAQFPNGCWPQVWPLMGSYHDAATFNDDATMNTLITLQRAATGNPQFVPTALRDRARSGAERGIQCVLDAQVKVDGKLTAWGQQHDPLSLQPTSARSYELTSLTAQESASLLRFLIRQRPVTARLALAIQAAAEWLKAVKLQGYTYDFQTGRHDSPGAGPIWARMYEIGTNRPIFSDRNGIKLYDWNLLKDRRLGYAWYTYAPVLALRQYEAWARRNTQRPSGVIALLYRTND